MSHPDFLAALLRTWLFTGNNPRIAMVTMNPLSLFLGWIGLTSVVTFCLFGYDKACAGRDGARRVAESTLLGASALGGWPGGLLAMLVFRHKTSKTSFFLQFFLALVVFAGLCAGALKIIGVMG